MRYSTSIEVRLPGSVKLAVALWLVAEILAFVFVADLIGYPETVLLTIVTSLFGWTLLKRAGASVTTKLRAALSGRQIVGEGSQRFLDELLAGLGALALLVPGFVSDVVGLVLAIPAARDRLSTWLATSRRMSRWQSPGGRPRGSATIDLDPSEWRKADGSRHPTPKV